MILLVNSRRSSGKTIQQLIIYLPCLLLYKNNNNKNNNNNNKKLYVNRKLYVAFIDFQKAFDSISRKLLWPILQKQGIRGKLFRCVKSMYDVVKARVRDGVSLTGSIHCLPGVKQGDVCSPILFSLFINELALDIIKGGKYDTILTSTLVEIFILLFAVDIILRSETAVGLQNQMNILYTSSEKLQLKVNFDKSNIIMS